MDIRTRVANAAATERIAQGGSPEWLAALYASRGVQSAEMLAPPLSDLPSVEGMRGLPEMAKELLRLKRSNKKVVVVGDYDCDGATASAVMTRGLESLGFDIEFLVPRRLEHGYGLTPEVVRQAALRKPDVLITVDCGISSFDGIDEARRLGLPVFVTDHHLQGDSLPEAEFIVNPNQVGCPFPSKALCGAGVALYTVRAVREAMVSSGVRLADLPSVASLLGWVAIGTIADVVQLDAVNRSLVQHGLRVLRGGAAGAGVQALISVAKRSQPLVSTQDIAFALGPRINAAGRMSTMDAGVNLLLGDGTDASRLAHELDFLNVTRREVEANMAAEAQQQAEALVAEPGRKTLVACHEGWHEGVIGIVAGRLKEKLWRPTVVLAPIEGGGYKGSARSIPGLHLRDCLARVDQLYPGMIRKFGGHAAAAGLTLAEGQLDAFKDAFEVVAGALLSEEDMRRVVWTDGPLPGDALTLEGARRLNDGLWGQGMPVPLFMDELELIEQRVLKDKATGEPKHLKLTARARGVEIGGIWFNQAEPVARKSTLLYTLGLNEFRGEISPQLLIQGSV